MWKQSHFEYSGIGVTKEHTIPRQMVRDILPLPLLMEWQQRLNMHLGYAFPFTGKSMVRDGKWPVLSTHPNYYDIIQEGGYDDIEIGSMLWKNTCRLMGRDPENLNNILPFHISSYKNFIAYRYENNDAGLTEYKVSKVEIIYRRRRAQIYEGITPHVIVIPPSASPQLKARLFNFSNCFGNRTVLVYAGRHPVLGTFKRVNGTTGYLGIKMVDAMFRVLACDAVESMYRSNRERGVLRKQPWYLEMVAHIISWSYQVESKFKYSMINIINIPAEVGRSAMKASSDPLAKEALEYFEKKRELIW